MYNIHGILSPRQDRPILKLVLSSFQLVDKASRRFMPTPFSQNASQPRQLEK